jgi:hypothetical protein
MKIYNYLFYKGYQLAVKSKNFENSLVYGAIIVFALLFFGWDGLNTPPFARRIW